MVAATNHNCDGDGGGAAGVRARLRPGTVHIRDLLGNQFYRCPGDIDE